ncbi:putative Ig domain-containing protein, partial [Rhodoferax sp.]|uniref:putative Ig domain-containing protein n=1 Tax=Rhodoferax sp. TaxID=50421 RepID=UPI0028456D82
FTPTANRVNPTLTETTTFTVSVSDGIASAVIDSATSVVSTSVNDAPTLQSALQNQSTLQDQPFSFVAPVNTFADVDFGDIQTLSATLVNGAHLPSWLVFDPISRTFSGVPSNPDLGTISVKLTATDIMGATVSTQFDLTVTAVAPQAPPVVVPLVEAITEPANTAAVMLSPMDPNTAFPGPSSGVAGPSSPIPLVESDAGWTLLLGNNPVSELRVEFTTASDSLSRFTTTTNDFAPVLTSRGPGAIQIAVIAADQPALQVFKGVPDQSFGRGTSFNFVVPVDAFAHTSATAVVRFSATVVGDRSGSDQALPSWLSFDPVTGKFSGEPPIGITDSITIRVVARDSEGRQVETLFHIRLGEKTKLMEKVIPKPQSELDELDPHAKHFAKGTVVPVGRASLSEQIRLVHRHAPGTDRMMISRRAA